MQKKRKDAPGVPWFVDVLDLPSWPCSLPELRSAWDKVRLFLAAGAIPEEHQRGEAAFAAAEDDLRGAYSWSYEKRRAVEDVSATAE